MNSTVFFNIPCLFLSQPFTETCLHASKETKMISTVEILSGSANIGRYQNIQKPPNMAEKQFLTSPLFYSEPNFFSAAMSNEQHKNALANGMDSFLRPKPKQDMTIMKHFSAMEHHTASQIQKDPVNLAVFSSQNDYNDDSFDQKEIDVVGLDNNNTSSFISSLPATLRIPKASYPKISDTYHHFNFNNFATSAAAAAENYRWVLRVLWLPSPIFLEWAEMKHLTSVIK